jgi:hypothetical protein
MSKHKQLNNRPLREKKRQRATFIVEDAEIPGEYHI